MTTETLVKELALKGQPIKPLPHPLTRFILWALASIAAVAFGLAILGVRSDLSVVWAWPIQVVLATGLVVSSVVAVLILIVPGRWNRSVYLIPVVFLAAWTAFNVYAAATDGNHGIGTGLNCVRNILALSVLPALLLIAALRLTATPRTNYVLFLATLGVLALSCLATRFVCPQDGAVHFLVWHYIPVVLLSTLITLVGHLISRCSEARGKGSQAF